MEKQISGFELLMELAKLTDSRLVGTDKAVLCAIAAYFNPEKGYAYPSLDLICASSCCERRTAVKAIRRLEECGFLKVERLPGRGSQYVPFAGGSGKNATSGNIATSIKNATSGKNAITTNGKNATTGSGKNATQNINRNIKGNINSSPSSSEDGECASASPTHSPLPVFVFDPNLTDEPTEEEEECPFPVTHKTLPTPSEPPFSLSSDPAPKASKIPPCPVQRMVDIFNEKCGDSMRRVRIISSSRRQALSSRWRFIFKDCECVTAEDCLKAWEGFIFRVQNSDFLMNRTERKYRGGLDGLITERGFLNVIEGKYDNHR